MTDQPKVTILSPPVEEMVANLREARTNAAAWTKIGNELRDEIIGLLHDEDATKGLTASGAPAVTLVQSSRRSVDRQKLEAKYPEVFADVVTETQTERLDIDLE